MKSRNPECGKKISGAKPSRARKASDETTCATAYKAKPEKPVSPHAPARRPATIAITVRDQFSISLFLKLVATLRACGRARARGRAREPSAMNLEKIRKISG